MADTAPAGSIKAGGAYVEVFAVDGKLNQGLKKAEAKLQAFSSKVTKIGAAMTAAGTAITGGLTLAAKSFADTVGEIDDMSQRTGVAVEALSRLGYAAKLSGTDIGTLEGGLKKMQKSLYDADEESKSAQQTLANLGLSIGELQGMTPDEQFKTIAEAISNVQDPTRKAALAMKIFGGAGQQLVPMLSQGRKGLEEFDKECDKVGGTITGKMVKAASVLGDAFDRMELATRGLRLQIGEALAPAMTKLMDGSQAVASVIGNWAKENAGLVAAIVGISTGLAAAGTAVVGFGLALAATSAAVGGISAGLAALPAIAAAIATPFGAAVAAIATVAAALAAAGVGVVALHQQTGALNPLIDACKDILKDLGELCTNSVIPAMKDLGMFISSALTSGMETLNPIVKELSQYLSEVARQASFLANTAFSSMLSMVHKLIDALEDLQKQRALDAAEGNPVAQSMIEAGFAIKRQARQKAYNVTPTAATVNTTAADVQQAAGGVAAGGKGISVVSAFQNVAELASRGIRSVQDALKSDADELAKSLMSPAEKLEQKTNKLKLMLSTGAIDQDLYDKAEKMARVEVGAESGKNAADAMANRTTNAAALQQGSQEAMSAIVQAMNGKNATEDQIAKNTKDSARDLKTLAQQAKKKSSEITVKQVGFN